MAPAEQPDPGGRSETLDEAPLPQAAADAVTSAATASAAIFTADRSGGVLFQELGDGAFELGELLVHLDHLV